MTTPIRNVYCVGRNYRLHAAELGNAVPDQPMLFMKPTHSVVLADGGSVPLPGDRGQVHYETELVLRIGRDYEPGLTVDELVDSIAIGIDFTLRDVQDGLKKKGHPWLAAKGFRNSAPVGAFRPFPGIAEAARSEFSLRRNGTEVQRGNLNDMIFSPQTIVDFVAAHFGLGEGDVIFTGTPEGVGAAADGDRFELYWAEEAAGNFTVRLEQA
ncbi:fumarylacetoacetate hydrolase family protein [Paenibacillus aurantius]|uniref:Fumarylacetoacetate hydrolase family protein n=1 Tax=Paenibacillus aurantius TaxID=2918900 RepID=A0AA96RDF8_9BACL|nr:fumarylacetoacetate hydrolase family protein [Paenibacillus aurantius]WNQ09777.1 fumarylacetoacetate hydrolase family protein [Paenibacillus aurantius]